MILCMRENGYNDFCGGKSRQIRYGFPQMYSLFIDKYIIIDINYVRIVICSLFKKSQGTFSVSLMEI